MQCILNKQQVTVLHKCKLQFTSMLMHSTAEIKQQSSIV